jgi:transglutaminase-like putative cysteine protease
VPAAHCPLTTDHCLWHTTNQFRYLYPTPVTSAVTRLRLLPRVNHGTQRVVSTDLRIEPHPRRARSWTDPFGNCVLEVEHPCLPSHLEVTAEFSTSTTPVVEKGSRREMIPVDDADQALRFFLPATPLVDRSPEIHSLAEALRQRCATDEELAWECMGWVYKEMKYLPGSTGVATPASDALAGRMGVCQDFAQVMLAVCRAAGLPARYVSGHLEGEGQMHAWVEVLYPAAGDPLAWHPLDPTHDRTAAGGYVTVAAGRDYADVSPISGYCYGPTPGRLSCHQQMRRYSPKPLGHAHARRM